MHSISDPEYLPLPPPKLKKGHILYSSIELQHYSTSIPTKKGYPHHIPSDLTKIKTKTTITIIIILFSLVEKKQEAVSRRPPCYQPFY